LRPFENFTGPFTLVFDATMDERRPSPRLTVSLNAADGANGNHAAHSPTFSGRLLSDTVGETMTGEILAFVYLWTMVIGCIWRAK
jgi:hypothetical protein